MIFQRNVLNFDEGKSVILLIIVIIIYDAFGVLPKKVLPTPRLQRFSHIFCFTFRIVVHVKLILSHDIRYKSHFPLYRYPILVSSVRKSFFPPIELLWHLCQKLYDHIYMCYMSFPLSVCYANNVLP